MIKPTYYYTDTDGVTYMLSPDLSLRTDLRYLYISGDENKPFALVDMNTDSIIMLINAGLSVEAHQGIKSMCHQYRIDEAKRLREEQERRELEEQYKSVLPLAEVEDTVNHSLNLMYKYNHPAKGFFAAIINNNTHLEELKPVCNIDEVYIDLRFMREQINRAISNLENRYPYIKD